MKTEPSCCGKLWRQRSRTDGFRDPPLADWSRSLGIPELVVRLLHLRGLDNLAEMDLFLSPLLRHLAAPAQWPGMEKAVNALLNGVDEGREVVVWGDYDVDGITGTALIMDVLEFHGIRSRPHLPDRCREGYGVNAASLERLAAEGVGLLLTVDCGISDFAAVERAKELGMMVVITDHHLPPPQLPRADAICNPRLSDCPCPHLAGVGVAFFLMAALNTALHARTGQRMDLRTVLDLVALGTLADMVKLTGQNRVLVKNGLLKLTEARRPGIAELKAVSGFTPGSALGAGQVVFNLAPRINAAGRLGTPRLAFDLLRCTSHDEAARIARELDAINTERRAEEERIFEVALGEAQAQAHRQGLVVVGQDWHQGVIGIVASRLVEALHRPVVVLCHDGDTLKGSGRSVTDFDLHAGLCCCADQLIQFGGHKQAAGLRLAPAMLDAFRDAFDTAVRRSLGDVPPPPSLVVDGELPFAAAADLTVLKSLELLQPFGIGNAEPVFTSLPLQVRKRRVFGPKRDHVTLEVVEEQSGIALQAKAWRQAATLPESLVGQRICLAFTPGINAYNGVSSVELRIRDLTIL